MSAKYTVIQYVPDPIADERINVGVLVFDRQIVRTRFVSKWDRIRQFANQDIQFLKNFARGIAETDLPARTLNMFEQNKVLSEELISAMAGSWINTIQFTEPRASLKNVDDLLGDVAERFLYEPRRNKRGFRDRLAAVRAARAGIRHVLAERVGDDASKFLKQQYPVQGKLQSHTFDVAVANGTLYFAANGVSFELPKAKELQVSLDAVAWAINDVRSFDLDIPLAVVALPPKDDTREHKKLLQLYRNTVKVYTGLGAEVITEQDIEPWAARMISRIPV